MKAAHAKIQYVLQMTKLAIIPFTVLLETIFLKKRFRLVRKIISSAAYLLDVLFVLCSDENNDKIWHWAIKHSTVYRKGFVPPFLFLY